MSDGTEEKKRGRRNDLLLKFVSEFKRDEKEYQMVRRIVEARIRRQLDREGIMAIVTSRVKDPDRLLRKLKDRDNEKHYATREDIFSDIPDLVGARIALYFPGDAGRLEKLLKADFEKKEEPKVFPGKVDLAPENQGKFTANLRKVYPGYPNRRFDGYCAIHYRGYLKRPPVLTIPNPIVEIQVASVLMHAWSEVEHDLAYKNLMGQVSMEEYEALDEINGLVIAGEVALNRLDRLSQVRLGREGVLNSVYVLAGYLEGWLEDRKKEWFKQAAKADKDLTEEVLRQDAEQNKRFTLGDVQALFDLYSNGGKKYKDIRKNVKSDLKELDYDPAQPLAQQLLDMHEQVQPAPPKLLKKKLETPFEVSDPAQLGQYIVEWINLQRSLRNVLRDHGFQGSGDSDLYRFVNENFELSQQLRQEYQSLYLERNKIIHGNYAPSTAALIRLRKRMADLLRIVEDELL